MKRLSCSYYKRRTERTKLNERQKSTGDNFTCTLTLYYIFFIEM